MQSVAQRFWPTLAAFLVLLAGAAAAETGVWSASDARAALQKGEIVMIDLRSREEWAETGVPEGAWPISLHEERFEQRLFAAQEAAGGRPVALICATGGRTGFVARVLRANGYAGFVDVSEGMEGSRAGPGWIARGYPVLPVEVALEALPDALR